MIGHTGELPAFTWPAGAERRPSRVIVGLAAAVFAVVIAWTTSSRRHEDVATTEAPSPAPSTGIVANVGRRASHGGRYHAEVVTATPFATGAHQTWTVRLTRRGHRRVSGARLTARTWAPETGEVSPVAPSVRYVGGGRYRVDGVYFPRPGWWNVAFVIEAATGTDSVAFNVVAPTLTRSATTRR